MGAGSATGSGTGGSSATGGSGGGSGGGCRIGPTGAADGRFQTSYGF